MHGLNSGKECSNIPLSNNLEQANIKEARVTICMVNCSQRNQAIGSAWQTTIIFRKMKTTSLTTELFCLTAVFSKQGKTFWCLVNTLPAIQFKICSYKNYIQVMQHHKVLKITDLNNLITHTHKQVLQQNWFKASSKMILKASNQTMIDRPLYPCKPALTPTFQSNAQCFQSFVMSSYTMVDREFI